MEANNFLIEEMKWPDVENMVKKNPIIFIAVGSIEQHGPHLPLGTDVVAPYEFAKKVAKKIGALVAPPIRPGISPHHMPFPGTITLRPATLIAVIKDYCRCLSHHGFKKIVLLNGHGGNRNTVQLAVQEVKDELPDLNIAAFEWWTFIPKELGSATSADEGIHANRMETAWMLAFAPNLVDMTKAVTEYPSFYRENMPTEEFFLHMTKVKTIADLSKSGVVGPAAKASKEDGEELVEKAVERGIEFFEKLGKLFDSS